MVENNRIVEVSGGLTVPSARSSAQWPLQGNADRAQSASLCPSADQRHRHSHGTVARPVTQLDT